MSYISRILFSMLFSTLGYVTITCTSDGQGHSRFMYDSAHVRYKTAIHDRQGSRLLVTVFIRALAT